MPRPRHPQGLEPVALVLLTCDQVYTDQASGKSTLLGLFSAIAATEFPFVVPQICIFVVLTEGRGRCMLSIKVIDAAESMAPLVEEYVGVEFRNPLDAEELTFQMFDVEFPAAGEYRVQLFAGAALLAERRMVIDLSETDDEI